MSARADTLPVIVDSGEGL